MRERPNPPALVIAGALPQALGAQLEGARANLQTIVNRMMAAQGPAPVPGVSAISPARARSLFTVRAAISPRSRSSRRSV